MNNFIYLLLCLIWGTTWLAIKVGLDALPPFLSASIRFLIASTLLFLFMRLKGHRLEKSPDGRRYFFVVLSLFWITIPYGLVYWGEQYVSSGLSSILFATMPFYIAVLGHFMLEGESLDMSKVLGLLTGFLGLVVIYYGTMGAPRIETAYGVIALMLCPVVAAISNVVIKRRIAEIDPLSMNAQVMAYGAISLFLLSLLVEPDLPADFSLMALLTLFYLGVLGSAVAFVLYVRLLKTETVLKMSLIVYITPVIALFVGWFFRGESITPGVLGGAALVFAGVYLVTKRRKSTA